MDALERMLAMRAYKHGETVHGQKDSAVLQQTGMDKAVVEDMYQIMAIANYEDRFVIQTSHKKWLKTALTRKAVAALRFAMGVRAARLQALCLARSSMAVRYFSICPSPAKLALKRFEPQALLLTKERGGEP